MRALFNAALDRTRELLVEQIQQARRNGVQLKVSNPASRVDSISDFAVSYSGGRVCRIAVRSQ